MGTDVKTNYWNESLNAELSAKKKQTQKQLLLYSFFFFCMYDDTKFVGRVQTLFLCEIV